MEDDVRVTEGINGCFSNDDIYFTLVSDIGVLGPSKMDVAELAPRKLDGGGGGPTSDSSLLPGLRHWENEGGTSARDEGDTTGRGWRR